MAALTIDPTKVREVRFSENSRPAVAPIGEAGGVDAGEVVRWDATSGKWVLAAGTSAANAGNVRFIALGTDVVGRPVSATRRALVDLGPDVLTSANFGAPVYLSDTPGKLTLIQAESTASIIVGYVAAAWGGGAWATAGDNLLDVI